MRTQRAYFEALCNKVMARIREERMKIIKTAKKRLAFFGFGAVVSLGVMVPVFQWIGAEFYKSGFYQFVSLIFSDTTVAMTYWKELGMSLVESFPVMEATVLLSVAFIFLWLLKLAGENASKLLAANFQ